LVSRSSSEAIECDGSGIGTAAGESGGTSMIANDMIWNSAIVSQSRRKMVPALQLGHRLESDRYMGEVASP
jgi:hypothetical protein